jgi:hypothetical protein
VTSLLGVLLALAVAAGAAETDPAAQAAALDWTVGTWHGVRVHGADGSRAPLELRVEAILGGSGHVERLRIGDGKEPYLGFAVQVYSPAAGRWERRYVNGVHRRFVALEGEVVAPGRVVWRPAAPDPSRRSRVESEHLDDGSWRRTMHVSEDGGDTWHVLWRDEMRRAGS